MRDSEFKTVLPNGRGAGWLPDLPKPLAVDGGKGDYPLSRKLGPLPRHLTGAGGCDPQYWPRVRDQGQLGSCTGFALRNALAYLMRARYPERLGGPWGQKTWDLSPLAAYWLARKEAGLTAVDSGAYIREVVDAARKYGTPTEKTWPYDVSQFKKRPNAKAFEEGRWHQADNVGTYRCDEDGDRVKTVDRIVQALDAGLPVEFGFTCGENITQADSNGVIPAPDRAQGGHAMTAFKADIPSRYFLGPNSWSNRWGARPRIPGMKYDERGYFLLPFAAFLDGWADDAWAIDLEKRPA